MKILLPTISKANILTSIATAIVALTFVFPIHSQVLYQLDDGTFNGGTGNFRNDNMG